MMKGVLLNAVEEAVSARWGEQMWDELLTACDLEGAYTALETTPTPSWLLWRMPRRTGSGVRSTTSNARSGGSPSSR